MKPEEVLDFWFKESGPEMWFATDAAFDERIREQFLEVHHRARRGELWHWRETLEGRLAEIIVLDQFSRNLFRGQSQAFSQDGMALVLAQEALPYSEAEQMRTEYRQFLYMPFMHAESMEMQEKAVALFQEEGLEESLPFAEEHRDIVARFGRFPHRNAALNRESTAEEVEFMREHEGF